MRKIINSSIRKIFKSGNSYAITLPIELVKELGWRDNQKVEVERKGNYLVVKDWE